MTESLVLKEAAAAIARLREKLGEARERRREPIAIIGMAGRTPFESHGVTMWDGLSRGIDASRDIPNERWDADALYEPNPRTFGKWCTKRASMLSDVAGFDASFFSVSPMEASAMDPQQRLLLETTWEALANAGTPLSLLRRVSAGVFVGAGAIDYGGLAFRDGFPDANAPYVLAGVALSVIAGRISYAFGLTGPSLVVDTACSSSLVALHLACESLRTRSSDVTIAGGVNLILQPELGALVSLSGAMSSDGRCRSFDAAGTGYGRGEGCGVVVLKRLSDAIRDRDRVLALIRATAVNQDGRSDGLTAPNGLAQEEVIRAALDFAKIDPNEVQYVEAHGTGTVLGDPIEVEALSAVYGAARTPESPLMIGSLKSNIGHLESAAGISGVLKLVLSLRHRQLPPSLHFETPNPHIAWDEIALRVQTKLGPWPQPEKPLIAGVSGFGMSGTNAHALVSEAPVEAADVWATADQLAVETTFLPLCISAKTPEALRAYVARFQEFLSSPLEAKATWRDVAFTSSVRQTHLEHRLVVHGGSPDEWRAGLDAFSKGERSKAIVSGDATRPAERVVFVFNGQGTQWWAMGRDLIARERVFREVLEECDGYIRQEAPLSLMEELQREESASRLSRTDVAQPALVALQIALARLLESWGIVPSSVVGHSVGEISAACVAGVLSLEQACHVATIRGRVMHKATGRGRMVSVRISKERAETLTHDFPGQLVVGAYNSPQSVVLSGDAEAVAKAIAVLSPQGVGTRELGVDYAFHSPQMRPFKGELIAALASLKPGVARIPIVSTLTGSREGAFDAGYWAEQMSEMVQFVPAIQTLLEHDEVFVEVGPHPVLLASIDEIASHSSKRAVVIGTLRRNEEQAHCALQTLGALHAVGYPVDWTKLFAVPGRTVSLPSYPWERKPYWLPARKKSKARGNESRWALIHASFESSEEPGKHFFELELDAIPDCLLERKLNGAASIPAAAMIEMVLEAAKIAFEGRMTAIDTFDCSAPIHLAASDPTLFQLIVQPAHEGACRFRIASRSKQKTAGASWTEHASGRLVMGGVASNAPTLRQLQLRCTEEVSVRDLYSDFEDGGLLYGAPYRAIAQATVGEHEALSRLAAISELTDDARGHILHPLLLEAALQTLALAVPTSSLRRPHILEGVGHLHVLGMAAPRWIHVALRSHGEGEGDALLADVHFLDESGLLVAEMTSLRAKPFIDVAEDAPKARRTWDVAAIRAQLWTLLKPFASQPGLTESTNLLAGVLDSLGAVSFLRAVEKAWSIRLSPNVRGQFDLSVSSLSGAIAVALTTDQTLALTDQGSRASSQGRAVVRSDPTRPSAVATATGRSYPELFGPDGLSSTVWSTDIGLSLEVLEQGKGRPLLLLPPVGCEMTVWTPFLRHFENERRVIAPNLPGFGKSPRAEDVTLEAIASSLLAVLDRMAPAQPIDVVGWSLGGFIAQLLAAAAPKRFGRLILVNTTAYLGANSLEAWADLGTKLEADLRRDLPSAERPAELERLVYWGKESRSVDLSLLYGSLIQSWDGRSLAPDIEASTLVVAGENDLGTPPAMALAIHESLSKSRIEVLPNTGHYLPLLRPEEFAKLAKKHLIDPSSS